MNPQEKAKLNDLLNLLKSIEDRLGIGERTNIKRGNELSTGLDGAIEVAKTRWVCIVESRHDLIRAMGKLKALLRKS